MTDNWLSLLTWGVLLALLQVLAALPWLSVLLSETGSARKQVVALPFLGWAAIATIGGGVVLAGLLSFSPRWVRILIKRYNEGGS